jgi:hypothetical protein
MEWWKRQHPILLDPHPKYSGTPNRALPNLHDWSIYNNIFDKLDSRKCSGAHFRFATPEISM